MSRPIYIAVPMGVDISFLNGAFNMIHKKVSDNSASWWIRGTTYSANPLQACKALIVILPDNKFKIRIKNLPPGTRSELEWAIENHIPIFLGYRTSEGEFRVYETSYNRQYIEGVGGTFNECITRLKKIVKRHAQQQNPLNNIKNVLDTNIRANKYFAQQLQNHSCVQQFSQQEVDGILHRVKKISPWWWSTT